MNLFESNSTYEELIQHMEEYGYSSCHIQHVKREMKWLSANQDAYGISSYEEACRLRSLETESAEMKEQFRSIACFGVMHSMEHFPPRPVNPCSARIHIHSLPHISKIYWTFIRKTV